MTRRNLEMYRGDTVPFTVTVENAGNPINVTGYSFRMTAKYSVGDSDANAVFSLTSPSSIVLTDPTNGLLTVTIPSTATNSLSPRVYRLVYDIQMYDAPGTVYTICSGLLQVNPDVSISTP